MQLRVANMDDLPTIGSEISEDPTITALSTTLSPAAVPATMSHPAQYRDDEWVEVPDELQGTAVFDATGDKTTMPSWDELVRQHADRVYRLAYRLSGNQQDAEDLTQETFIRVFRSVQNYQPGTFEGWLHRITTNLFLDMVRRRTRIRMEALPEDYDRVPADEPDPQQIYHDARLGPDLQAALDSLPPEFRAAVVLCDVEGLSYEEIGATLGVKLGTVRSRIHRGRQALRDYLAAAFRDRQVGLTDPLRPAAALHSKNGRQRKETRVPPRLFLAPRAIRLTERCAGRCAAAVRLH